MRPLQENAQSVVPKM